MTQIYSYSSSYKDASAHGAVFGLCALLLVARGCVLGFKGMHRWTVHLQQFTNQQKFLSPWSIVLDRWFTDWNTLYFVLQLRLFIIKLLTFVLFAPRTLFLNDQQWSCGGILDLHPNLKVWITLFTFHLVFPATYAFVVICFCLHFVLSCAQTPSSHWWVFHFFSLRPFVPCALP